MTFGTFSIVGFDPAKGELGVAVESKFIAVGAVVPFAQAGVGALATQSYANTLYGPRGLALLESGLEPEETIAKLTSEDPEREERQVGVVDARGRSASFTGKGCLNWAGHRIGRNHACQGNILAGPEVVDAMAETFEASQGDLVDRLLLALEAGQRAGGDRRGQQSAALLVVREKGGYGGFNDRYVDLRVDDSPQPIKELRRVFELYDLIMLDRGDPSEYQPVDASIARELQELLKAAGFYRGPVTSRYDDATRKALEDYAGVENLENRLRKEDVISKRVLQYLKDQVGIRGGRGNR
jgi:uncharacterized Ntn-hydrolase superfamily protein